MAIRTLNTVVLSMVVEMGRMRSPAVEALVQVGIDPALLHAPSNHLLECAVRHRLQAMPTSKSVRWKARCFCVCSGCNHRGYCRCGEGLLACVLVSAPPRRVSAPPRRCDRCASASSGAQVLAANKWLALVIRCWGRPRLQPRCCCSSRPYYAGASRNSIGSSVPR
jgi:hypothetical protein